MKKSIFVPGGNPTLLIDNRANIIQPAEYHKIGKSQLSDDVEQVGFIEKSKESDIKLTMMGNELCVNAIRSLALWNYGETGSRKTDVECLNGVYPCELAYWVSINIRNDFLPVKLRDGSTLVKMDGIAHFVRNAKDQVDQTETLKNYLRTYGKDIERFPSVGLISMDNNYKLNITVFVRKTKSIINETACGSGTIAAYLATGGKSQIFIQPSGCLYMVTEEGNDLVLKSEVNGI